MHRLRKAKEAVTGWARTVGRGAALVATRGGRMLKVTLSVVWIVVMLTGAFTVFRLTYGRPWFSAPASMVERQLEAEARDGEDPLDAGEDELLTDETAGPEKDQAGPSRGDLMWPVGGPVAIQVQFGLVTCPTLKRPVHHTGVDIAAEAGSPVMAAYGGTVIEVSVDQRMGNRVLIDHGGGIVTVYASLEEVRVSVGQKVAGSHVLGTVGNSGLAEVAVGPHLHFEVLVGEAPVNPQLWLGGKQ